MIFENNKTVFSKDLSLITKLNYKKNLTLWVSMIIEKFYESGQKLSQILRETTFTNHHASEGIDIGWVFIKIIKNLKYFYTHQLMINHPGTTPQQLRIDHAFWFIFHMKDLIWYISQSIDEPLVFGTKHQMNYHWKKS